VLLLRRKKKKGVVAKRRIRLSLVAAPRIEFQSPRSNNTGAPRINDFRPGDALNSRTVAAFRVCKVFDSRQKEHEERVGVQPAANASQSRRDRKRYAWNTRSRSYALVSNDVFAMLARSPATVEPSRRTFPRARHSRMHRSTAHSERFPAFPRFWDFIHRPGAARDVVLTVDEPLITGFEIICFPD